MFLSASPIGSIIHKTASPDDFESLPNFSLPTSTWLPSLPCLPPFHGHAQGIVITVIPSLEHPGSTKLLCITGKAPSRLHGKGWVLATEEELQPLWWSSVWVQQFMGFYLGVSRVPLSLCTPAAGVRRQRGKGRGWEQGRLSLTDTHKHHQAHNVREQNEARNGEEKTNSSCRQNLCAVLTTSSNRVSTWNCPPQQSRVTNSVTGTKQMLKCTEVAVISGKTNL